jgi:hypothetical protein
MEGTKRCGFVAWEIDLFNRYRARGSRFDRIQGTKPQRLNASPEPFGSLPFQRFCLAVHGSCKQLHCQKAETGSIASFHFPNRPRIRPLLLLGFWNLLCRGCAILLLARGGRLDLLLRRVLVRGFRRFVTHSSNPKVHDNWCQFCKQRASVH